ncbi:unnamed protein product, partial [Ilex paraguariensis]
MANTARPAFFNNGPTNFYGEFNAVFIDIRFNFLEQYHRTSPSYYAILTFIVPTLINLLQLKCQGDTETPFETHPKTMLAGCVYGVHHAFGGQIASIVLPDQFTEAE